MTELTMSQFASRADYDKAVEREELRKMLPKHILKLSTRYSLISYLALTYDQTLDFAQLVLAREREKTAALQAKIDVLTASSWVRPNHE